MAGVIGTEIARADRAERCAALRGALRSRDATSLSDMPRECRIGTFDSDSRPPAMTTSAWPSTI
jgi:hypothetical protein